MLDQNTFLITWNPSNWDWTDLQQKIEDTNSTGKTREMWSFIAHTKVKIGDRVFLMRLGKLNKNQKGIMASGYVSSEAFPAPHWDGSGEMKYRVYVEFDIILDVEKQGLLSLEDLQNNISSTYTWTPQGSGVTIPKEVADKLERSWFNITLRETDHTLNTSERKEDNSVFLEGSYQTLITRRYERNPHARKVCLNHYKYACSVCGLSFEDYYGEIGRDYIHVHHLTPISITGEEYQVDPIKDLRPVCPNCHAMLHRKSPPYTIEQLIDMIKRKQ